MGEATKNCHDTVEKEILNALPRRPISRGLEHGLGNKNKEKISDDELYEVSSEKQRRWACAQKDKPASERADSLSAAEAEEMCTAKIEEDG